MKAILTFKNPDYMVDGFDESKMTLSAFKKLCEKWLEYDEYVRIEIDTEKKTAKVLEA